MYILLFSLISLIDKEKKLEYIFFLSGFKLYCVLNYCGCTLFWRKDFARAAGNLPTPKVISSKTDNDGKLGRQEN